MRRQSFYQLIRGFFCDWFDEGVIDLRSPELWIPSRYCENCRKNQWHADCCGIVEIPPPHVVDALQPYQIRKSLGPFHALLIAYDKGTPQSELDRLNDEVERDKALLPHDFDGLVAEIRSRMNIGDDRLILPRSRVGPDTVIVAEWVDADIIHVDPLILSEKAASMLESSGLSGYEIHPLNVFSSDSMKLYSLIVVGDGGVPAIQSKEGEWRQCPECRGWHLFGPQVAIRQAVDETQWDGSDFFHLAKAGSAYISEAAKAWMLDSGLSSYIKMEPLEEICFRPDLPEGDGPIQGVPRNGSI